MRISGPTQNRLYLKAIYKKDFKTWQNISFRKPNDSV